MPAARARGWGNPDSSGYRQRYIVKIVAGGVPLYVRREVAHLFKGFLDELVATGYRLHIGALDDWGYINRDIRGRPGVKSNHSWGLAVDINARTNPMGDRLVTDLPAGVSSMAKRWGLTWGGDYRGRKDAMHFEYEGTPADVARYPLSAPKEADMTPEQDARLRNLEELTLGMNHQIVANEGRLFRAVSALERIEAKLDRLAKGG